MKMQPITAPKDVQRYFITAEEAGQLCLVSALYGSNRDIFFPKNSDGLPLTRFPEIARRYLESAGYEPFLCDSEYEARARCGELIAQGKWPCFFFDSDTTGEKDFEEFFTDKETLDMDRFKNLGIIKNEANFSSNMLDNFLEVIDDLRSQTVWEKAPIVDLFNKMIPDFDHIETGKYLDGRM